MTNLFICLGLAVICILLLLIAIDIEVIAHAQVVLAGLK